MNTMSLSEFKRLRSENIEAVLPLSISVDGFPLWIIGRQEDLMSVGDLHIRVRNSFRAQEKRARIGMEPGKQLFADELQEPLPVPTVLEPEVEEVPRTAVF